MGPGSGPGNRDRGPWNWDRGSSGNYKNPSGLDQ